MDASPNAPPRSWDLAQKHPDLTALAIEAFGDEGAALNWFYSVHPQWGLLPIYVARTPDGATRVSEELASILNGRKPR